MLSGIGLFSYSPPTAKGFRFGFGPSFKVEITDFNRNIYLESRFSDAFPTSRLATGSLNLEVGRKTSFSEISIRFKGVRLEFTPSPTPSDSRRYNSRFVVDETITFFSQNEFEEPWELVPGTYRFPFEFIVDLDLPESVVLKVYAVMYDLTATIKDVAAIYPQKVIEKLRVIHSLQDNLMLDSQAAIHSPIQAKKVLDNIFEVSVHFPSDIMYVDGVCNYEVSTKSLARNTRIILVTLSVYLIQSNEFNYENDTQIVESDTKILLQSIPLENVILDDTNFKWEYQGLLKLRDLKGKEDILPYVTREQRKGFTCTHAVSVELEYNLQPLTEDDKSRNSALSRFTHLVLRRNSNRLWFRMLNPVTILSEKASTAGDKPPIYEMSDSSTTESTGLPPGYTNS
ncbi:uncharacterized protein KQ657_001851 [Scheffersomyces spartinae]|uniref:Arrestin-like N-terminal domain-containing protein n=1 Tax=Scheffersomyces spartinae TaxID=45513 RepID=A0A9P7V751_9ASCO|nr:uncharacterized protein KQ657_001851 [Scheffersomyces spartinae]KAG7192450.1 hypothetical protein KQ657_001851 [Scheffersomyces spartinae]